MNIPIPIIHTFKEINVGKSKTVQYFELIETRNGESKLSKLLNISVGRGFSRTYNHPKFWVKERGSKKWINPALTGLFETKFKRVYFGDKDKRNHLLIFQFNDDQSMLKVFYFENYYTTNLFNVFKTLFHV